MNSTKKPRWCCHTCGHHYDARTNKSSLKPCVRCHQVTVYPWGTRWVLSWQIEWSMFNTLELLTHGELPTPNIAARLNEELTATTRRMSKLRSYGWAVQTTSLEPVGENKKAKHSARGISTTNRWTRNPGYWAITPLGEQVLNQCYEQLDQRVQWLEQWRPENPKMVCSTQLSRGAVY